MCPRTRSAAGRASKPSGGSGGSRLLFESLTHRAFAREHRGAHHLAEAIRDLSIRRLVPEERPRDPGPAAALVADASGDVHVGGLIGVEGQLPARLGRNDPERDDAAAMVAVELAAKLLPAG